MRALPPLTEIGKINRVSRAYDAIRTIVALSVVASSLLGCTDDSTDTAVGGDTQTTPSNLTPAPIETPVDDLANRVVVAVIDAGFNPYHVDMRAGDLSNQSEASPSDWVVDFKRSAFSSLTRLNLTVEAPSAATIEELMAADDAEWKKASGDNAIDGTARGYWIPGSKIIGSVSVGPLRQAVDAESRGAAMASAVAGNIYGTCPSCLVVFVNAASEEGVRWVSQQDWIDVQINAWHLSDFTGAGDNSVIGAHEEAVTRGQAVFAAAGNGRANEFIVPNDTYLNNLAGPDWVTTVGAVNASTGGRYAGSGRPVDIAAPGNSYPTGTGETVAARGEYSGTEIATPIVAGLYAESLYRVRLAMQSNKRLQRTGVVATGMAGCGAANPECAAVDGAITHAEIMAAMFHSAQVVATPIAAPDNNSLAYVPGSELAAEDVLAGRGHGVYYGRSYGEGAYQQEVNLIVGYLLGQWHAELPDEMREWFAVDSACRQHLHGEWADGYAAREQQPPVTPQWPVRSTIATGCPYLPPTKRN